VSEAAGGSGGMLSYFQQGLSSYVPLRSAERTNEEEAYLSLSHWDRYVCMHLRQLSWLYRVSAGEWSVLSLFVLVRAAADPAHSAAQICARFYARECPVHDGVRAMLADSGSFAILTGPAAHMKHFMSPERRPFSAAYVRGF